MPTIVTFRHIDQEIGFISSEINLRYALLRGFQLLIQEFGDEHDRITEAQDKIIDLNESELQGYKFITDVRAYRSELTYVKHKEVSHEQFQAIYENAEYLNVYCN